MMCEYAGRRADFGRSRRPALRGADAPSLCASALRRDPPLALRWCDPWSDGELAARSASSGGQQPEMRPRGGHCAFVRIMRPENARTACGRDATSMSTLPLRALGDMISHALLDKPAN